MVHHNQGPLAKFALVEKPKIAKCGLEGAQAKAARLIGGVGLWD